MNGQRLKLALFSLIGVFNTLFDIVVYTVILDINHSILIANTVSTTLALLGSYFLNSRITFKSKRWTPRNFIMFVVVTLFGLWVLQTSAIYLIASLFKHTPSHYWQILGRFDHIAQQVIPKLIATVVTFVWNYTWYNKVIFRESDKQTSVLMALDDL